MIVLDASVLIAHLESTDAHHDRARALLLAAVDDLFAASPLTLAEVLVHPARMGQLDTVNAALGQLEITPVELLPDAPLQLAVLRAATGLKLPDCCVLLAAESARATIATFDDRLASAARARGLVVRDN